MVCLTFKKNDTAIIRDALQEYGFFDIPNFKLMAEPGRYMNYGTISCACQITGAYERNGYHARMYTKIKKL